MLEEVLLVVAFFFIAMIYASVGFGGGSSYLALMAQSFFAFTPDVIRPTALICNIVVVTGGAIVFYRSGSIRSKEVWPFLLASVPMAYLGGRYRLGDHAFFILLGITLALAALLLWFQREGNTAKGKSVNNAGVNLALGSSIGFLSGLVSIGGGIFLSPVLHLLRWSDGRSIAGLASLFILVNSVSGLVGQLSGGNAVIDWQLLAPLMLAVLAGGQVGSRLGAKKFRPSSIKKITAALIFLAAINILRDHL